MKDEKKTKQGKRGAAYRKQKTESDVVENKAVKRDKGGKIDYHHSATNDWRWYANNPQLLKDTASFAYGYPLGSKLRIGGEFMDSTTIPGVMALRWIPTVGYSDDANSPINVCSRNLYSFIRQANSGGKNYDANDLMIYLVAYDSAISFLSYMKRLYGTLQITSQQNRYYPRALVRAQKGDYDTLITQLADLRAYINMFAVKLSAMCIPAHMSIFAKHKWMNEGIYLDAPDAKAQTYLFVPEGYHYFQLDADGAGMCRFKKFPETDSDLVILEDLMRIGNAILDPILYNAGEEDFNIISGDILKAYGPTGVYRAEGITEDYVVLPSYDEVVLSQIQNATLYGFATAEDGYAGLYDIVQSPDKRLIIAKPRRNYAGYKDLEPTRLSRILTTKVADPTPEFTMEASRLMTIPDVEYTPGDGIFATLHYRNVGSELLTRGFMYVWQPEVLAEPNSPLTLVQSTTEVQSNVTVRLYQSDDANVSANEVDAIITTASWLSNFDWHPMVYYIVEVDNGGGNITGGFGPKAIFGDVSNYAIINKNNLDLMSTVALMSEFGLESFGKSSIN